MPSWLPNIVTLTSFGGSHQLYLDHLYQVHLSDFVTNQTSFCGLPIVTDGRVLDASGRSECFIHLTTCDDYVAGTRNFEPRRSERVPWTKPTIDNCGDVLNVKIWEVTKKGKHKVNILIESERYHIVLTRYKKVFNLTTAYYVDRNHTLSKLLKEYSSSPKFVC